MYVTRITTNETCNQACAFCNTRRPAERAALARLPAVLERVDEALAAGTREVVLTGGEPARRADLPALVAYTKRRGAASVVLETNATLISDALAGTLARGGLDRARIHLPAWGEQADTISRDPGGFERTRAGMQALARAGIRLEAAAPVVRDNLATLETLPRALSESGLRIEALVLGVPVLAPDESTLVTLAEAAVAIGAVAAAARGVGLTVRVDPAATLPPCLFPRPAQVAHLFSLTRGGADRSDFIHLDACDGCTIRDRCPGVPRAAWARDPTIRLRAVDDDRTRRRLSMVSTVEDQIARELVTRDVRRHEDGSTIRENIVRINFHCNQACRFCFVSTHLPPAEDAAIEAAIAEIGEARGVLSLSGGEPTLHPRLASWVRLGKRLGAAEIELQTNAVRLADPALTRELEDAGVDLCFVSLHGATAAVSDRVTEAPGTFDKTVLGLDQIARSRMALRLNFVFCEANLAEFPDYIEMVARRWPSAPVTVSFVAASTDVVPHSRALVPRFTDVMPHLAEGVRRARALGVRLTGFESMCGVPLCQIPDDLSAYFALAEIPDGADRGEFRKAEACAACALERRCFGVRRGYAELHGTTELRPVGVMAPS